MPPPSPWTKLTRAEVRDLAYAKVLLERPGLAARVANVLGNPIEKGFALLPANWAAVIQTATKGALMQSLEVAISSLGKRTPIHASRFFHKILAGASGAVGGAFGLAALPFELPVSTTLMLRSIADIARGEGHDVRAVPVKLACLEVFALGGRSKADDAAESSYWVVRAALAKAVSEAASYLAQRGVLETSAPAMVRLVAAIAARFGVIVSEQVAAKAVPIVGAASGSVINLLFMDHFQDMARGHFIVKRLEAKYGVEEVQQTYSQLAVPVP